MTVLTVMAAIIYDGVDERKKDGNKEEYRSIKNDEDREKFGGNDEEKMRENLDDNNEEETESSNDGLRKVELDVKDEERDDGQEGDDCSKEEYESSKGEW